MELNEQTLAQVGKRVLESMAFALVSADPVAEDHSAAIWEGSVRFSGPHCGSTSMRTPEAVLAELGNSMLGLEEGRECTEQQRRDVLGELTNVFCGNLVEALSGSARAFDLGTPEVRPHVPSLDAGSAKARGTSVRVGVEKGWVELCLVLDDGKDGQGV